MFENGKDITEVLEAEIDHCAQIGRSEIDIPAGTFHFRPRKTIRWLADGEGLVHKNAQIHFRILPMEMEFLLKLLRSR